MLPGRGEGVRRSAGGNVIARRRGRFTRANGFVFHFLMWHGRLARVFGFGRTHGRVARATTTFRNGFVFDFRFTTDLRPFPQPPNDIFILPLLQLSQLALTAEDAHLQTMFVTVIAIDRLVVVIQQHTQHDRGRMRRRKNWWRGRLALVCF